MAERGNDGWVLAVALFLPTVITYFYFVHFGDNATVTQQAAYVIGKIAQFSLPVLWLHRLPATTRAGRRTVDWWLGVGFGVVVVLMVWVTYFAALSSSPLAAQLTTSVQQKITGLNLATPARYLALGIAYSVVHSWLEEYYWRWFVYGQLRHQLGETPANLVSSVGFTLHHIVVLVTLIGWSSPWTYVFCVGVALGGSFWAWLYERSRCLGPIWCSHLLVDAAIFGIGYVLVMPLWEAVP